MKNIIEWKYYIQEEIKEEINLKGFAKNAIIYAGIFLGTIYLRYQYDINKDINTINKFSKMYLPIDNNTKSKIDSIKQRLIESISKDPKFKKYDEITLKTIIYVIKNADIRIYEDDIMKKLHNDYPIAFFMPVSTIEKMSAINKKLIEKNNFIAVRKSLFSGPESSIVRTITHELYHYVDFLITNQREISEVSNKEFSKEIFDDKIIDKKIEEERYFKSKFDFIISIMKLGDSLELNDNLRNMFNIKDSSLKWTSLSKEVMKSGISNFSLDPIKNFGIIDLENKFHESYKKSNDYYKSPSEVYARIKTLQNEIGVINIDNVVRYIQKFEYNEFIDNIDLLMVLDWNNFDKIDY